MVLFSSLTLVAAVLALFDVTSAQMPTYTYITDPSVGLPMFSPGEVKSANTNWVFPLLHDLKWNQLLHNPGIQKQLENVLSLLKNYTHSSKISPTTLQQVALHHEDIYNFMHHFAEILRYHPNWKTLVHPYVQQHHWPSKYLNKFEQMMLFFLLHSFPGHHSTKPNLPLLPYPPQYPPPRPSAYPPFDPYPPFPQFMGPMEPRWFPSPPWMDGGFGNSQFEMPSYPGFPDPNHPLPPIPNFMPHYDPFPVPVWNQYPGSFPHAITIGGRSNCAEMVNVTVKVKIYNDVTCTASVYVPRQSLKNILAVAAQDNNCFKFKTQRRASRTGGKQGEFVSSVNTIDENDVSRWAVHGTSTLDAELNSYKPTNGETITVTFYLLNKAKGTSK